MKYQAAKRDIEKRDEAMDKVEDKFEKELILLGGTAVEDRLQDEVRKNRFNLS